MAAISSASGSEKLGIMKSGNDRENESEVINIGNIENGESGNERK